MAPKPLTDMTLQPPILISVHDDGQFPNSPFPVIVYKNVLTGAATEMPALFENLFYENGWSNTWRYGIFTRHHYHSITHEVLGVCSGTTLLQLGGGHGETVTITAGDVVIIPAGVAHKNLGGENDVTCVGAYPDGMDYDINYGKPGERPQTDANIAAVPFPSKDPVKGPDNGLRKIWNKAT